MRFRSAELSQSRNGSTHRSSATLIEEQANDVRFRTYEAPFNSDSFFWTGLAPRAGYRTGRRNIAASLGRMRDIPRYFDEQIVNMRAGLKRGFSVPRVTLEGRDASLEPFTTAETATNPFFDGVRDDASDSISAAEQAKLRAEAKTVIAGRRSRPLMRSC